MPAKRLLLILVGSVAAGTVAAVILLPVGRDAFARHRCRKQLSALWFDLMSCADETSGRLPGDLDSYLQISPIGPRALLVCPATGRRPMPSEEVESWSDYLYVPNLVVGQAPPDSPLVYDRLLANHNGKGINVLLLNGVVMWDSGGVWLKEYAAKFPDRGIALPQDAHAEGRSSP